jgi:hypothetical protein
MKSVIEGFYLLGYKAVYSFNVNRRFGGTCRLHFQGRRNISQARNQREAGSKIEHFIHTAVRILNPIRGRAIAQAVSRWLPTAAIRGSNPGLVMWDLW